MSCETVFYRYNSSYSHKHNTAIHGCYAKSMTDLCITLHVNKQSNVKFIIVSNYMLLMMSCACMFHQPQPVFLQPSLQNKHSYYEEYISRADSKLAPSQWETSLRSNAVSYWLGANLESSLMRLLIKNNFQLQWSFSDVHSPGSNAPSLTPSNIPSLMYNTVITHSDHIQIWHQL